MQFGSTTATFKSCPSRSLLRTNEYQQLTTIESEKPAMIVTPRLDYIHLHRTGGSYISRILQKEYGGHSTMQHPTGWRHDRPLGHPGDKPVLGSVRNPFSYYVSRFHFIRERRDDESPLMAEAAPDWVFSDFRRFLEYYVRPGGKRRSGGHAPDVGPMCHAKRLGIGHMTHTFLHLYACPQLATTAWYDHDYDSLEEYWQEEALVDMIVQQENLQEGLTEVLKAVGYDPTPVLQADDRVNEGPERKHYSAYYTSRTKGWVEKADSLILNLFEYEYEREPEAALVGHE